MPVPQTYGQIKCYLGMKTFYCRHIRDFALIRSSLNEFQKSPKNKNKQRIERITDRQPSVFNELNQRLADAALLHLPGWTRLWHCTATHRTEAWAACSVRTAHPVQLRTEPVRTTFFYLKSLDQNWRGRLIFKNWRPRPCRWSAWTSSWSAKKRSCSPTISH